MVTVNDDIATKLAARFPDNETAHSALMQRYRHGISSARLNFASSNFIASGPTNTSIVHSTDRVFMAVDMALDDWSSVIGTQSLFSKWEVLFNLRGWLLQINAAGNLVVSTTPDGSTIRTFTSSVATGFANGTRHAVGFDYDGTSAGNRTVTFYTATSIELGDWVALGAVQSQVGEEQLNNPGVLPIIGGDGTVGFTNRMAGNVYAAQIKDGGVNGTVVSHIDFTGPGAMNMDRAAAGAVPMPPAALADKVDMNAAWMFHRSAAPADWRTSSLQVFSRADTPAYQITGDIDIRVKVKLNDWSPASTHWVLNHGNHTDTSPSLKWVFSVHPNSQIRCFFSADGTLNVGSGPESVGFAPVDGSEHFLRCTFDADTGGTDSTVTYMESFDNGQSWVNIGSPIVDAAGPITMFNNSANPGARMEIGRLNPGAQTLRYAEVRNGIGGPIVMAIDLDSVPLGSHGHVDLTGNAWYTTAGGGRMEQVSDRATWDQLVAHYAASSPDGFVDDQKAFWNAFVP